MENYKTCLGDMTVQLPHGQTMTGEVIEELTKNIKQELPKEKIQDDLAGLAVKIESVKEETVDLYGTEQYFENSILERQVYETEEDKHEMKVHQNECDGSGEFINRTLQCESDIADQYEESPVPVACKEDIDIKYEDFKTESIAAQASTSKRRNTENDRRERSKKIKLYEKDENQTKPEQAINHGYKLSSEHKAKSKVNLHKCHRCSYGTKQSSHLKKHMLMHKANSEVNLFKCHECLFATKYAESLKMHVLVHKAKSEVDLYRCRECSFVTKHAKSITMHVLIHKAKSEVDLYKCQGCSYETKRSSHLKKHMLIHKAKSEVDLFKCHECSFATKYADSLKTHMLIHKAKSEVALSKCHECSYVTKLAGNLKRHMLIHKAKSEVDIFKCHQCSLVTKYAESLKRHLLIHKAKL